MITIVSDKISKYWFPGDIENILGCSTPDVKSILTPLEVMLIYSKG